MVELVMGRMMVLKEMVGEIMYKGVLVRVVILDEGMSKELVLEQEASVVECMYMEIILEEVA